MLSHRTRTSPTAISDRRMGQRRRKVVAGSEEKLCKVDKAAIFRHWSAHCWLQHSFMESTSDPAQFLTARHTSNSASNQAGHISPFVSVFCEYVFQWICALCSVLNQTGHISPPPPQLSVLPPLLPSLSSHYSLLCQVKQAHSYQALI